MKNCINMIEMKVLPESFINLKFKKYYMKC